MTVISDARSWILAAPDAAHRLVPVGHSARIVDTLLAALIVVRVSWVGGYPTAQLAIIALVVISLFRRPTRPLGLARWFPWLALTLIAYSTLVSLVEGVDPWRRAGNLSVLMLMAAFLASGRIDIGSAIKGLWLGLIVNAALFYLHVAPNDYAGRLTGYLQDPNAGGLMIASVSILCTLVVQKLWLRAAVIGIGALALYETGSRTSTAAYIGAVVWLCLTPRLGRGLQIALGAFIAAVFVWVSSSSLATDVATSAGRVGSDALRSRIDQASADKVAAASWHGFGLGQGTVDLDGGTWFFNSSYQDLVVEGGILLTIGVIGAYVLAGFGIRTSAATMRVRDYDARVVAATTLVIFFCASRLGEVFFSPTGMFVLGVGLARLAIVSQQRDAEAAGASPPPIAAVTQ